MKLVSFRANGDILTNVVSIHFQTKCNDGYRRHQYILPIAIVDPVSSDDVSSISRGTPADLHWGRRTGLSGYDIERGRRVCEL